MDGTGTFEALRQRDEETYKIQARRMSPAALARIFPHRHVAPAPITAPVKLVRANAAPKKEKQVRLSSGLRAEIAAYAFKAVDKILADRLREAMLDDASIQVKDRPTAREVIEIVGLHADIRPEEFMSRRRHRSLAWPRQIAMALVKDAIPVMSYPQIGRAFGGKDHTTVMHAVKRTRKYMDAEDAMAQLYRRSRETIEARWPEAFK